MTSHRIPPVPSRRDLIRMGAGGALAGAALSGASAQAQSLQGGVTATAAASPRRYGAIGDGQADDRAAFARLDAAEAPGVPLLVADGTYKIGSDLTLNRGIEAIGGAGRIIVPAGVTVRLNGPVNAHRQQIFAVAPGGELMLDSEKVTVGFPEWWGEGVSALRHCVRACPVTDLAARDYLIDGTWVIDTPHRTIRGAGLSDGYDRGHGTRIICTNGSVDAVRIGSEREPRGGPSYYLRNVVLTDCTVQHSAALRLPARGNEREAPVALRLRYLLNAQFRNLAAWEPAVGFHCHGLVYSKIDDCRVFRSAERGGDNDFFRGFWLDGEPKVLAGGNASLYLQRCGVQMGGRPSLVDATGFWLNGGFVDCFLTQVETSEVPTGIKVIGSGKSASDASNLDLHITAPVLDQCSDTALEIAQTAESAMVEVIDLYAGSPARARYGIHLHDGAGQIGFIGGQVAVAPGSSMIGFLAQAQDGIELRGLKLLWVARPMVVNGCSDFLLEPWINGLRVGSDGAAVLLAGRCTRGVVRPAIKGSSSAYGAGVWLTGPRHRRIEVGLTRIDPRALRTGAAGLVRIDERSASTAGRYASSGAPDERGTIEVSGIAD